jgi:hypothetical protein
MNITYDSKIEEYILWDNNKFIMSCNNFNYIMGKLIEYSVEKISIEKISI